MRIKSNNISHSRMFLGVLVLSSALLSSAVQAQLVAAVLPSSRSAEVGSTITVFATVINAGTEMATGCVIEGPAGLPVDFDFQTTNPATNEATGVANAPVDLAPGGSQSYVLSLTPTAIVGALEASFSFACTSGSSATTISGVNTLLLSASDSPVADVIALAATAQNTGALSLDNAAGAFALATINLGAPDTVTVTADTGNVNLPVMLSLCQTDSTTGACLASPASEVTLTIATGATPTFSIFSTPTDSITNDPAVNRVFVRFTDSNAMVRGGTSVAIENTVSDGVAGPLVGLPQLAQSNLDQILSVSSDTAQIPAGTDATTLIPDVLMGQAGSFNEVIACGTGQILVMGLTEVDAMGGSSSTQTTIFENCDGVTGSQTLVTDVMIDGDQVSFVSTQNGSYSADNCEQLTITDLRIASSFNLTDPLAQTLEMPDVNLSGSIAGSCEGEVFSCDLQGVDLSDGAALGQSCAP